MQTLHALGALVIVMLLAVSIQHSLVRSDGRMVRNETEAIALAAATDVLDRAGTLRFDAQPNTLQIGRLTPAANFGMASSSVLDARDIDDLHGLRDTVRIAAPGGLVEMPREVSVRYVTQTGGVYGPSANPTFVKEITVVVRGPSGAMATLTRLYGHRPGLYA